MFHFTIILFVFLFVSSSVSSTPSLTPNVDDMVCRVAGDPHFRTFSGCLHDYQNTGFHTLFSSSYATVKGEFTECGATGHLQTCLRRAIVTIGTHSIKYGVDDENSSDFIDIDGTEYGILELDSNSLPDSISVRNPLDEQVHIAAEVEDGAETITFHVRIGHHFTIVWMPARTDVVGIHGLCGTPDSDSTNDVEFKSGSYLSCDSMQRLSGDFLTAAGLLTAENVNLTSSSSPSQLRLEFRPEVLFEDASTLQHALDACTALAPTSDHYLSNERDAVVDDCLFDWNSLDSSLSTSNINAMTAILLVRDPTMGMEVETIEAKQDDTLWISLAIVGSIAVVALVTGIFITSRRARTIRLANQQQISLLQGNETAFSNDF